MPTETHSGPATIVASGMVTAFMAHPIRVVLAELGRVTLVFTFVTDATFDDVDVQAEVEENEVRFTCVNFDRPDGRGTSTPVGIGRIDGLDLWVHFRVFRFGNTDDHTLHYTVYGVKAPPSDEDEHA